MSVTSYLAEFKARVEVIKGTGGKPGLHNAAIKLVCDEKGLTTDALNASGADTANKKTEVKKEATNIYLAALLCDGLSNVKYAELKTYIANQTLQGKGVVPKSYDMVWKLASGWHINASRATSKNIEPGTAMYQHSDGGGRSDDAAVVEALSEVIQMVELAEAEVRAEVQAADEQAGEQAEILLQTAATKQLRPSRPQSDQL